MTNTDNTAEKDTLGAKAQETTAKAVEAKTIEDDAKAVSDQNEPVAATDLEKEIAALRSTKARLLEENQRFKAQTKQAYEEKLKAEGKKDELIETLKKENEQIRLEVIGARLEGMLSDEGAKHGCINHVHLYNNAKETLNDLISIDDETGSITGVKEFFDAAKSDPEYSFYFKTSNPIKVDTKTPEMQTPFDYKRDPLAYLKMVKAKSPEKFNEEVARLTREGYIQT